MKHKWIIQDWTSNVVFTKEFDSFEEADEYLTLFIEEMWPDTVENDERFSEERGEYYIVTKGE